METNNETEIEKIPRENPFGGNKAEKNPDDLDFFELMERNLDNFQTRRDLAESVIRNAQKGDAGALKILQTALLESKYKKEEKLIVTDEQLKNIITLASDRIRGQGPLTTPSGTY